MLKPKKQESDGNSASNSFSSSGYGNGNVTYTSYSTSNSTSGNANPNSYQQSQTTTAYYGRVPGTQVTKVVYKPGGTTTSTTTMADGTVKHQIKQIGQRSTVSQVKKEIPVKYRLVNGKYEKIEDE